MKELTTTQLGLALVQAASREPADLPKQDLQQEEEQSMYLLPVTMTLMVDQLVSLSFWQNQEYQS